MMALFGLGVRVSEDERRYEVDPGQAIHPADIVLPPDVGSAAFGLAAAALHPSDVRFRGLVRAADHPEGGLYRVLDRMCVPLSFDDRRRSEEHTSELQSPKDLVCRLLLEKKKK